MGNVEPPRILVLDDDEMALVIARKLLEAENCVVDVSTSPKEALAKLQETHYDAVLCDMWMPQMSGREFYEEAKNARPEYQRRIILITGDVASEPIWEFIDERHLPYLIKPYSPRELRRRLREVVGERAAVAQPESAAPGAGTGAEKRRHRRVTMKANIRVRRKKWAVGGPDIQPVVNAGKEGVLFLTDREYRVGTEVFVAFPYVGHGDIEQEGYVVRVEELSEGRRGVAVALGEAAAAARLTYAGSEEDARRHDILGIADLSWQKLPAGHVTAEAAKLARDLEEARRLATELTELKSKHDRVVDQRDQLAKEEAKLKDELRELNQKLESLGAARETAMQEAEGLKAQMEILQKDLAVTEEVRFQATHDALTGLLNRGAILDILKREVVRAQREGTTVGTVIADLDHFKEVNDTYGHLVGDAVLREAAQRITAAVRTYDAVGRYGGEEFLVVLSGYEEASDKEAERIRQAVSAEPVSTAEGQIPVTISLGVASSGQAQDLEAMLRAADAALYQAKRGGRNRVVVSSGPPPTAGAMR